MPHHSRVDNTVRDYPCDCGEPLAVGAPMCAECMDACEPVEVVRNSSDVAQKERSHVVVEKNEIIDLEAITERLKKKQPRISVIEAQSIIDTQELILLMVRDTDHGRYVTALYRPYNDEWYLGTYHATIKEARDKFHERKSGVKKSIFTK